MIHLKGFYMWICFTTYTFCQKKQYEITILVKNYWLLSFYKNLIFFVYTSIAVFKHFCMTTSLWSTSIFCNYITFVKYNSLRKFVSLIHLLILRDRRDRTHWNYPSCLQILSFFIDFGCNLYFLYCYHLIIEDGSRRKLF